DSDLLTGLRKAGGSFLAVVIEQLEVLGGGGGGSTEELLQNLILVNFMHQ
ncbi:hypothetical protein ACJX0J_025966, partial [Zea mays]